MNPSPRSIPAAQGESASPAAFQSYVRRFSALLFVCLFFSLSAKAEIRYEVSLAHPEHHLFHVTMEIPDVHGELQLQMPAWNATYVIRDFSSHVQQVEAYVGGQRVPIEKLDKQTWQVRATGTVTVKYATYWDDPGPFDTQLNSEHAFLNLALVLLYVRDRRSEESSITFPDVPVQWNLATALRSSITSAGSIRSFRLQAASYDSLVDAPIEASKFEEFEVHDITPPVHVVIHGDNYKKHEVEAALRKIVLYENKLMDGAPYESYTFIFHIGKAASGAGGGMEHANSTAIFTGSGTSLLNVSAHEFFHLWNVKRIRPASLEPVDYTREMYTRSLWFAEGVTDTYAAYSLVRTGLWSKDDFYRNLGMQISELENRPAEKWQSAEQSSLDAWLEKYALYNQPQRSVSYYTKGQVLGLLLDILIRDRTDNQRSLDDVLRAMNVDFARAGKFYRDSLDVRLEAEKIAGSSLEEFFSRYVSAAQPMPYADLLPRAGLDLRTEEMVRVILGFQVEKDPGGAWTVAAVEQDSGAQKAGLQSGDEILRWNSGDVPRRPGRWAAEQKPGSTLHLRIRHDGKEQAVDVPLGEIRQTFYQISESRNATPLARRIREGLLKGTTDPITSSAQK